MKAQDVVIHKLLHNLTFTDWEVNTNGFISDHLLLIKEEFGEIISHMFLVVESNLNYILRFNHFCLHLIHIEIEMITFQTLIF